MKRSFVLLSSLLACQTICAQRLPKTVAPESMDQANSCIQLSVAPRDNLSRFLHESH